MSRIKAYRQLEVSDCGITFIRIIARYYGKIISMSRLQEISDTNKIGISINNLVSVCDKMGLYSKALKLKIDELGIAPLPLILYWNNNHFIVLYKIDIKRKRFYVVDPALGKLILKVEDFLKFWLGESQSGVVLLVEPTSDFYNLSDNSKDSPLHNLRRLLCASIMLHKRSFSTISFLTFIALCADISIPFIFKCTIDDGINGKNIDLVWLLICGQFFVFLGNFLSSGISELLLTKLGLRLSFTLMSNYLKKIVQLPMSFFDCKVNSDLIQKIDDQNRIKNLLVSLPKTSFFTIINIAIFSAILIYFNYWVFVIYLGFSFIGMTWVLLFQRKRREVDYSNFIYSAENRNNLYELINGMPEIKAHNAQVSKVETWEINQQKINQLSIRSTFISMAQNSGSILFSRIKDIIITGLCASLVISDQMSIGIMMTINYLVGRLSQPLSNLYASVNLLQDASISYERLYPILNYPSESAYVKVKSVKDDIVIDNISFKYPGSFSPFVLNGFSCVIPKGKTTAIVGVSGSGKTTLLKLIMGFYNPQKGDIRVNGQTISEIINDSWLANFGVVMQNGYIFSSSIKDNIALAESTPDMDRVRLSAKLACIDEFIDKLPMKYDTRVGNTGIELSGGQKQRMLIARMIYKNPSIIVLDEATSSLDAANERRIVDNLNEFSKGKTMIIAAHRLSTVRQADRIIYIEKGTVKEIGTHDELIQVKGGYYSLIKNQLELGT